MSWEGKISVDGHVMAASNSTFGRKGTILERSGCKGYRQHRVNDTRTGPYRVNGTINVEPSGYDLALLIAWALGTNDTLTPKTVIVDRVAAVYTYANTVVNKLTISGGQGDLFKVAMDLIGTTETAEGTVADAAEAEPLSFCEDLTLTLATIESTPKEIEFVIDNDIDADRFLNTLTLTDANTRDRIITLKAIVPFNTTHLALYNQALAGAAGSLVIAECGTLAFGTLQVPPESPDLSGKDEDFLTLNMQARASGATADVTFTDSSSSGS